MRLLLSLFILCANASWWDSLKTAGINAGVRALGFPTTDDCKFSRLDALQCIKDYVDRNHDGEITEDEFTYAKQHYLPNRALNAASLLEKVGFDYTLEKIKPACDANHDGHFTTVDWMASKDTCLPFQADLCKFKTVCDIAKEKNQAKKKK